MLDTDGTIERCEREFQNLVDRDNLPECQSFLVPPPELVLQLFTDLRK